MKRQFTLRTDASDTGIGAILLQQHGDQLFPVAYASKKLSDTEKHYATPEKECLAIIWGDQKLAKYIYGNKFIIQTDHQPLIYLDQKKFTNGRLMRWAMFLQGWQYKVERIKGTDNVGADYLSRDIED